MHITDEGTEEITEFLSLNFADQKIEAHSRSPKFPRLPSQAASATSCIAKFSPLYMVECHQQISDFSNFRIHKHGISIK